MLFRWARCLGVMAKVLSPVPRRVIFRAGKIHGPAARRHLSPPMMGRDGPGASDPSESRRFRSPVAEAAARVSIAAQYCMDLDPPFIAPMREMSEGPAAQRVAGPFPSYSRPLAIRRRGRWRGLPA